MIPICLSRAKTGGGIGAYSERFADYGRVRYRIQAHAGNCGADSERGARHPTVVPANDVGALAEKVRALNGNALVVGHGNTIPDLLKALGIATPVSIPEDDYSEIFVVLVDDPPQLLRLHYPF